MDKSKPNLETDNTQSGLSGIEPSLYNRLVNVLMRCDSFESKQKLETVFTDNRILAWKTELREANNVKERVELNIALLYEKNNSYNKNGLALFLRVLWDRADKTSAFRKELGALLTELTGVPPEDSLRPDKVREVWLKQLKFRYDPFLYTYGERDPNLIEYFYPVSSFTNIVRALSMPVTHLVLGEEGSGKSSLRNAIAQQCRIEGALPIAYSDFQVLSDKAKQKQGIQVEEHIEHMLKAAMTALEIELEEGTLSRESISAIGKKKKLYTLLLSAYVKQYGRNVLVQQTLIDAFRLNADKVQELPQDPYERLSTFFECVRGMLGYKNICFLIDPVNDTAKETETTWLVLQLLLSDSFVQKLSQDKANLVFFLNSRFRDSALTIDWINHRQATCISMLEWSEKSLRELLEWRLKYCSSAKPYESLGQLSDNVEKLDDMVIQKADNSPRNLIALCSMVFDVHCQKLVTENNLLITREEVAEAFSQWELTRVNPLLEIIHGGESSTVEFKSTLRVNLRNQEARGKVDKAIEEAVIKTLAGFINAAGGTLLIGIDDEGNVIGLKHDFATLRKKNTDGFELCFNELVTTHLGAAASQYIKGDFVEYLDELVFVVQVLPSPKPVFCGNDKVFYVRIGNSTRQLNTAEFMEYSDQHWVNSD